MRVCRFTPLWGKGRLRECLGVLVGGRPPPTPQGPDQGAERPRPPYWLKGPLVGHLHGCTGYTQRSYSRPLHPQPLRPWNPALAHSLLSRPAIPRAGACWWVNSLVGRVVGRSLSLQSPRPALQERGIVSSAWAWHPNSRLQHRRTGGGSQGSPDPALSLSCHGAR